MDVSISDAAPSPSESLGRYIMRVRNSLCLTQSELSIKAGIHVQTKRKNESGVTSRIRQKGKSGLAACGTSLRDRCGRCNEPIMSLKFRFSPYCGQSYKQT
mgnify:CR=1 FL=1